MKHLLLAAALFGCLTSAAETPWKPAGDRIKTRWAAEVDPAAPLPEYPRPTLVRSRWRNLNGLWNYSLTPAGAAAPGEAQGRILVPFPIESSLSGVQRGVTPQEALWYETTFEVPAAWRRGNDVLLHFGAVDWRAEVYVNDLLVGSHTGGYTPFSFDITPALSAKGVQKLTVKVTDSTDKGFQPHGKQVLEPHGIWYTPVTGIWQTVWIETVPAANHIAGITTRSDIRAGVLSVDVKTARTGSDRVCVTLSADGKTLAERSSMAGQPVHLAVEHPRLWSPADPYLYDLTVTLVRDGRVIDRAESYAALREIALRRVMGSTVEGVIWMFGRHYITIVAVCFAIAVPVAWYVVGEWLNRFAYRIPTPWWIFAAAFLLVTALTLGIVVVRCRRAASENPARVLGGE